MQAGSDYCRHVAWAVQAGSEQCRHVAWAVQAGSEQCRQVLSSAGKQRNHASDSGGSAC
jgi:hypothetical protein